MQWFHLYRQLLRHGRPVGLVLVIHLVAKGFATRIKYHRHVFRVIVRNQAAQHIDDTERSTGRLAAGIRQLLQVRNMEGTIEIG